MKRLLRIAAALALGTVGSCSCVLVFYAPGGGYSVRCGPGGCTTWEEWSLTKRWTWVPGPYVLTLVERPAD